MSKPVYLPKKESNLFDFSNNFEILCGNKSTVFRLTIGRSIAE